MSNQSQSTNPHRRKLAAQLAVVALALAILAWRAWPDGALHVMFLETKGDAALI
jgi:hypothetical protein